MLLKSKMFITNYYYDLPKELINIIDKLKLQLEFKIGDVCIYNKDKYEILKVNKKTFTIGLYDIVAEPQTFIKGHTKDETRLIREITYTNTIALKKTIKKETLENNAIKSNPISLIKSYMFDEIYNWVLATEIWRYD